MGFFRLGPEGSQAGDERSESQLLEAVWKF